MSKSSLCPRCGRPLPQMGELFGRCPSCMLERGFDSSTESNEDSDSAFAVDGDPDENAFPVSIGRYRIVRLIGEGGMGAVYEAEQEQPRRTVALKIIKPGMASPQLLRRFEQESQALGRLQHPGIAQIYEAGTVDTGLGLQPYFAMEFIRGSSPRDYAETHQVSTRGRLEIMAKVCDAVHHAHQRGLIHRDLKPGNILVDETGQPKILDFGVARVTDSDSRATLQTDMGQLVGTLAYMSPEQALADPLDIDTRSDVYALGVILYELLAGRLPYTISKNIHQAIQAVREEDPARLSATNRTFRGDIETIVAKALEKDRARRYASAAEMAADIQRHLNDEPIVARPQSVSYQFRKFAKRHRALVAGASAVLVVLTMGVAASTWQAARATQERDAAVAAKEETRLERDKARGAEQIASSARNRAVTLEEQSRRERDNAVAAQKRADSEAAKATAVQNFLGNDLLRLANPVQQDQSSPTNPNITVKELLDRAAQRIGSQFDKQPLIEAKIREIIAETYHSIGDDPKAREQLERAIDLRGREQGSAHPEALNSMVQLATVLDRLRLFPAAEALVHRVIQDGRRGVGDDTSATRNAITWLVNINTNGWNKERGPRLPEVDAFLMDLIDDLRLHLGDDNPTTRSAITDLVSLQTRQRRPRSEKAEAFLRKVFEDQRRKLGDDKPATMATLNEIFRLYVSQKPEPEYTRAETFLKALVEDQRRKLGYANRAVQGSVEMLLIVYLDQPQPKFAEAETLMVGALDAARRQYGDGTGPVLTFTQRLARLYFQQNRNTEAERLLAPLVNKSSVDRILKGGQSIKQEGMSMLDSMDQLSQVYAKLGKTRQADDLVKAVGNVFEVLADSDLGSGSEAPTNVGLLTMGSFGLRYLSEGRTREGNALIKKTLERYRSIARTDWNAVSIAHSLVAMAAVTLDGKGAQAEEFIENMLDIQRSERGDYDTSVIVTMRVLNTLYWRHGKYPEAEAVRNNLTGVEREVLGPTHAGTLFTMSGTAALYPSEYSFYRLLERPEQARLAAEKGAEFYAQYLAVLRSAPGGDTGEQTRWILMGLASVNAVLGRFAAAEILYTELQEIQRKINPTRERRMFVMANIGWLQFRQQKYCEAEKNLREAFNGYEQLRESWERFNVESMLGATLAAQGKYSEAEQHLVRGYEQTLQREPVEWRTATYFQHNLFSAEREPGERILKLYQDWEKPDKVEEWRKKVQGAPNFTVTSPYKPPLEMLPILRTVSRRF